VLAPSGVGCAPLTACEQALARGEREMRLGDQRVPLAQLLGRGAQQQQQPLAPAVRAQVAELQLLRALGAELLQLGDSSTTSKAFLSALDASLDALLGGSYDTGLWWSAKLTKVAAVVQSDGEETFVRLEQRAAASPTASRACELLVALGKVYERSHLLLAAAELPDLGTLDAVCDFLLVQTFPGLVASVVRLASDHALRQLPKLAHIFQAADSVAAELAALAVEPEPESEQHDGPVIEPEPQPEGVHIAPEEGVPPAAAAAGAATMTTLEDYLGGAVFEALRAELCALGVDEVSHFCACIESPCLRQCVHGAPIGGGARRARGQRGRCTRCQAQAGQGPNLPSQGGNRGAAVSDRRQCP
jgi:hypothetical protein